MPKQQFKPRTSIAFFPPSRFGTYSDATNNYKIIPCAQILSAFNCDYIKCVTV